MPSSGPRPKTDLVRELDESVRQVGWANIWTQADHQPRRYAGHRRMRTQLARKVFGRSQERSRRSPTTWPNALAPFPARSMFVADQGDRARDTSNRDRSRTAPPVTGVSVGDVQDRDRGPLGGKPITTRSKDATLPRPGALRPRLPPSMRNDPHILVSSAGWRAPRRARSRRRLGRSRRPIARRRRPPSARGDQDVRIDSSSTRSRGRNAPGRGSARVLRPWW